MEAAATEQQNRALNFNNALTRSTSDGIQQQAIYRKKNKPVIAPPSGAAASPKPVRQAERPQASGYAALNAGGAQQGVKRPHPSSSSSSSRAGRGGRSLVSFVLRRHPKEFGVGRLEREYIRTSCELKIEVRGCVGRGGRGGCRQAAFRLCRRGRHFNTAAAPNAELTHPLYTVDAAPEEIPWHQALVRAVRAVPDRHHP